MTDPATLVALSRAVHPPTGYAPPTGFERLFPFQQAATAQAPLRKHLLLAHNPGLGKTPMAMALSQGRFIVVCPPTLTVQWQTRIQEWMGGHVPILATGMAAKNPPAGSFIVGDSLVHNVPPLTGCDNLVIDEVHRLKSREARRTLAVLGGIVERRKNYGLAHSANRVIGLTGTPLLNSPIDLFPFLSVTASAEIGDWDAFTQRYCPPVEMRVPGSPFPVKRYDQKMQNLDELALKLRGSVMIRPLPSECQIQLPEVVYDTYRLPIEDPGRNLSAEDLASVFDPGTADRVGTVDKENAARLRREVGEAKARAPALISWINDLIAGGERPVVWCWHTDAAACLAARLNAGLIMGGVPPIHRQRAIAQYISGESKCLVATIASAGTGLDGLQHSGSLCIFVEQSFSPGENEQAVARLHRTGQTRGVRVVVVRSTTTTDAGVAVVLRRKSTMAQEGLA